ncbi:MAG: hypothetical protein QFC55_03935 [Chloroflexota bacterium]|nr:hypothetical protein [Chloroflexota bacterium]
MAPLETYCGFNIFASQGFAAMTCTPDHNSCSSNGPPPGTEVLQPITGGEIGGWRALGEAMNNSPIWKSAGYIPAVLIGHAGDPRQWECPTETRPDCARKFVVDRVAWVDGQILPLGAVPDQPPTRMTADEAIAVAQAGTGAIVAFATHAADVPTLDPRLHEAGETVMWLVRSIAAQGAAADDPTRSATVALIDDATEQLIESLPLAAGADSEPAILRFQATSVAECCAGNLWPRYEIDSADGAPVVESQGSGSASGAATDGTRFHAGAPAVLGNGDFIVHAWLSTGNADDSERQSECQTTITLTNGQEFRVEAAFPQSGPCTFVTPTFEDSIF